ncbi:MAG: ATP synthase F1 subunit gamma [Gemmatimonadaceae bacterium]|uniref:ATP synthase F1 subunit gamma n=1 Tax=Gemmatimonas sp. TaxID=1962908 RepID=UPI001DABFC7E|nr:ATP synthase F1 subunit gamma [Gemmatimonas sp.]NCW46016.1 ATP synthase F1 subunit gamma [Gemmatimonadaceae bacterium]
MAKGRELKGRIKSVENTRKITRTMEMVATSKMKRAADRVSAARPYALALGEVLSHVYTPELAEQFPLLRRPAQIRRAALVVLTANRGLCGAFNTNLLRESRARLAEWEGQGVSVELHVVGRKGIGFYKYLGRTLSSARADIGDRPSSADAASLIDELMARYAAGEIDAVFITYAKYKSALSTPPATEQVLPVVAPGSTGGNTVARDFILAPSATEILEALLPLYVRNTVYRALVETAAGEQGARRTAMKNATDNATEMLQLLKRTYNSARQAQITQEIAEIVGGASALQG